METGTKSVGLEAGTRTAGLEASDRAVDQDPQCRNKQDSLDLHGAWWQHDKELGGFEARSCQGPRYHLKDELKCLLPECPLPCCDVFAIQTIKQPMNGLIEAGHKLEES